MASEEERTETGASGMMRLQLRETTANTSGPSLDSTYRRAFELTCPNDNRVPTIAKPRALGHRDDTVPHLEGKLGETITRQWGI